MFQALPDTEVPTMTPGLESSLLLGSESSTLAPVTGRLYLAGNKIVEAASVCHVSSLSQARNRDHFFKGPGKDWQ